MTDTIKAMSRPIDPADLSLARRLFREYLSACDAELRATFPQVQHEMQRAIRGCVRAFEIAGLDAYFEARKSVQELASVHHAGQLASLAVALRNGSPLWVAGFADGLLEQIGAVP